MLRLSYIHLILIRVLFCEVIAKLAIFYLAWQFLGALALQCSYQKTDFTTTLNAFRLVPTLDERVPELYYGILVIIIPY